MSNHGRTAEDLSGLVFGRLTVIRREQNINGRTAWLCKCSCGNEKTVIGKYLKNGSVSSCGCLKRELLLSKANDYTGQRFGKLKVLYATKNRNNYGSVLWLCKCDCGNTVEVSQSGLVSGNNTSCGCAWENNKKHINEQLKTEDGTSTVLLKNRKYRKDNTSGFRGVNRTEDNRYRVFISFKGKKYSLGIYKNYTDAVEKRLEAEQLIFEGYIRSKEQWDNKEPLVFEVNKKDKMLIITSNDLSVNGESVTCFKDTAPDTNNTYAHHRNRRQKRGYNRHSSYHI